ncbi:MAG: hypothetical protein ACXAEN_19175 [Candidatus Thorarchaeota archaeon]|jgi:hypothetical protein
MSDKPWKRFERNIASIFGTTRALMKGTGEMKDIGPEDDFPLLLDCKHWKRDKWQIVSWILKLERAAQKSPQSLWPVLCLQEPGKKTKYGIVRQSPFITFITHNVKQVSADRFFNAYGGSHKNTPLERQWQGTLKEMRRRQKLVGPKHVQEDAIPMLSLHNNKHNLDLLILTPEDMARIFHAGGLLKTIGVDPL